MKARTGYLRAGAIAGVPIHLHASLPIGPLLFSGFQVRPGLWVGVLVIVLVHELGHAAMARARGCAVDRIEMHALGGACLTHTATPLDRIAIAWGGVLAQAWLALATVALGLIVPVTTPFWADVADAFVFANLLIAALNLLPFGPLDGKTAWQIVPALRAHLRATRHRQSYADDAVHVRLVEDALARAKRESRPERHPDR